MSIKLKTLFYFNIPIVFIFIYPLIDNLIFDLMSYIIKMTGYIVLIYLLLILSLPLYKKSNQYIDRKILGLITFFCTLIHFFLYVFDNNFNTKLLLDDLLFRKYIQSGYIALLLFIPLAITSIDYIKNLTKSYWHLIHRSIYIIIVFSFIHYNMIIKADYMLFYIYVFLFLLIIFIKLFPLYKNE
ncbi:MAG: hypothetical protein CMD65_03000 [Gammaproteobacteria bacterium]|nr:hypothetical protein [Gammaproteobacteria bacterium]